MRSLRSNGCHVLTSRCISLGMTATEELCRSWCSCLFKVLVCCGVGISRNDINLEVTGSEELSNSSRRLHCPPVVETRKTRSGYQLPLFGVIDSTCCRLRSCSDILASETHVLLHESEEEQTSFVQQRNFLNSRTHISARFGHGVCGLVGILFTLCIR